MNIQILYEDDFLMVINKPAGVVVNRVETETGETVEEWMEKKILNTEYRILNEKNKVAATSHSEFPARSGYAAGVAGGRIQNSEFKRRSGIVHRLDKETSGCLIIAKTPETFIGLQHQFRDRKVKKEYLALVHGRVEPNEGTIKVPIARSHHNRDKFAVTVGGRISETGYKVSQIFKGPALREQQGRALSDFSLLRVFPLTGRTHQIRVHFKYFGYPLVSDEKYAGSIAIEDRKWCQRIFLHAAKITFTHPVSKKSLSFNAQIPMDLEKVIKQLTI